MTVKPGDKIPDITLKIFGKSGMEDVSTASLFADKKVVLFGVPGAFTPTCTQQHLPDYLKNVNEMVEKGVDKIICMAVNDPFIMRHWEVVSGAEGKIMMLPDGNAALTKAMGLDMDGSAFGLGTRCKRFSMIVEDGLIKSLEVEDNPGELKAASAGMCLSKLKQQ